MMVSSIERLHAVRIAHCTEWLFIHFSSAAFPCFTVVVSTNSMSHFGHLPGLSETTSACCAIGQVYSLAGMFSAVTSGFGRVITGMRVMLQRGHLPALDSCTALCSAMGHV